jgi:hypothetical protein
LLVICEVSSFTVDLVNYLVLRRLALFQLALHLLQFQLSRLQLQAEHGVLGYQLRGAKGIAHLAAAPVVELQRAAVGAENPILTLSQEG